MPRSAVVSGWACARRTSAYGLIAGLCALGSATLAPAQTGAPAPTGGANAGPTPRVLVLVCVSSCAAPATVRPGSLLRIRGRALALVDQVVFLGAPGAADDVSVKPRRARRSFVDARVPRTAVTGPVAVIGSNSAESAPSATPLTVEPAPAPAPAGGGLGVDVEIQGDKVFYGAERKAQVSFVVRDSQPVAVFVEVVRVTDGVAIARWETGVVAPGTPQTATWDGKAGGRVQRDGRYQFRIIAKSQSGAVASSAQAAPQPAPAEDPPGSFLFLRHKFPIRGAHNFGQGVAAFGGGRNHQGQDVFAKCGIPLVAARAGVVKFKQHHSAAGHYIVVDGDDEGTDYAYMHMREASLVDKGDHVYTGQPIGFVGDTGRAHGCHLHFEMWKAPGWYSGGSAFDPLPQLKSWDAGS